MSVVVHEVSHGLAALSLGDPTAKLQGRLTLNPIKHIDPVGSVIVPIICALLPGSIMFGWAKPVPYNPYNLRNQRWGEAIVALAGPFSNLIIALIGGTIIRLAFTGVFGLSLPLATLSFITLIVVTNIVLAVFNLMPIPPLDGSKILFSLVPDRSGAFRRFLEKYSLPLILLYIFFLWRLVAIVVPVIFSLFTGQTF
ncbi:MAG: site-2 protease family protein [Candidatus Pacebacteria bacterium]|nr:site-2 protease family protein [Candidatus Paceibacterota bacterium]